MAHGPILLVLGHSDSPSDVWGGLLTPLIDRLFAIENGAVEPIAVNHNEVRQRSFIQKVRDARGIIVASDSHDRVRTEELHVVTGMAIGFGRPFTTILPPDPDAATRASDVVPPTPSVLGAYLQCDGLAALDLIEHQVRLMIDHPEPFLGVLPSESRRKVFISYSHKDEQYLQRLLVHIKPLQKAGRVDAWSDGRLKTGDLIKSGIEQALLASTTAVLLMSADFLASDFITENELPPILKRAQAGGTRIFTLIVGPSRFLRTELADFKAVNKPEQALSLLSDPAREVIYDRLAQDIEDAL